MEARITPIRNNYPHRKLAQAISILLMPICTSVAHATCTGNTGSPYSNSATEFCTGSDGNLSSSGSINSSLSINNSNNALIQFEGLGKTLTNTGSIDNSSTLATGATANRTRYGVFIGSYTVANTSLVGTSPGSGTAPTTGATTLSIASGLPATLVGQTVTFGRFDSPAGDFFPGETKTITAYNSSTGIATLDSALSTTYFGTTGDAALPIAYNIISGSGVNTINNQSTGVISASIGASEITSNISGATSRSNTSTAKAISSDVAGDYVINNAGRITASHAGVGGVVGIDGGGSVTNLTVNNTGQIDITRSSTLALGANTATSLTATTSTSGALSAQSIGSAAAVYSQEELDNITINNSSSGVIEATGNYTPAIYLRAGEQIIVNDGIIRSNSANGFAIGSVSDSGELRTLDLTNNGSISGDILAVNGNAVRWFTLSKFGSLNNRLNINSNWGQLDSTISNNGAITGNLFFSNGTHILTNQNGATLIGNIDVDQRDTVCNNASGCTQSSDLGDYTHSSAATNATVVGAKSFTFENAGEFNGDVTLRTASSSALGGSGPIVSSINLIPTITGNGEGSSLASPSANIAGMGNTLNLITSAGGDYSNVTVAPKIADSVIVKNGEYFKVADNFQINSVSVNAGASTIPNTDSRYTSGLVSWSSAVNASHNLVLESNVKDANTLAGITNSAANSLNALMAYSGSSSGLVALGSQIQALPTEAAARNAAEQLRPEINGATSQTILTASNNVLRILDNHLSEGQLYESSDSTSTPPVQTSQLIVPAVSSNSAKNGFMKTAFNPNQQASGYQQVAASKESATADNTAVSDNRGFWLEGITQHAQQGTRGGVAGYNSSNNGFALGFDSRFGVRDQWLAGTMFSTSRGSTNSSGVNDGNSTGINTYQGYLYGSWRPGKFYLNAVAGLGVNDISSSRNLVFQGLTAQGLTAKTNAMQYTGRVDAGIPYQTAYATLIPTAFFAYSRLDQSAYTESGGSAALHVNAMSMDSYRTGVGGKAVVPMYEGSILGSGVVQGAMEFSALWAHEFGDISTTATASFAAAADSPVFYVPGKGPGRNSGLFGAGARLNFAETDGFKPSVFLNYFAEVKDKYLSNTGMVQGRLDF